MKKIIKQILIVISIILNKIKDLLIKGLSINIKNGIFFSNLEIKGNLKIKINGGYFIKSKIVSNGKNNLILLENNVKVLNCIFVINGDNCIIKIRGERNIKNSKIEILDSGIILDVGENTGLNNNRIVIGGNNNKVTIGSDCVFAENAEIWASDTHSIIDLDSNKRVNNDKPIVIHDRVWVGSRVLIMKGVEIKSDSIIAAGSIVTKNVNSNTLVGGIPAKELKNRVKWDIKRL